MQRDEEHRQAIKRLVPSWHTQPLEELLIVANKETNKGVVNDLELTHDDVFDVWLEKLPPEKINYYLPSFSHGFCPHQTPLIAVCSSKYGNRKELVKRATALLDRGADVNLRRLDIYEDTPLLSAAEHSWPLCELLLSRGADITALDKNGKSSYPLPTNQRLILLTIFSTTTSRQRSICESVHRSRSQIRPLREGITRRAQSEFVIPASC